MVVFYSINYYYGSINLGLVLDRRLNFHKHFHDIMSNLNHKLYVLCKIRPFINTEIIAVLLYKTHLLSYLEYGAIFFIGLPVHLMWKIQRFRNKVSCICHKADGYTTNFPPIFLLKLFHLKFMAKSFFLLTSLFRYGYKIGYRKYIIHVYIWDLMSKKY